MKNYGLMIAGVAAALLAMPAAAADAAAPKPAASWGPHGQHCADDAAEPAMLVHITGFKDRQGQVKIKVFSDRKDEFLESGKRLVKFSVPVPARGDMAVCVPLPGKLPRYTITVLHDRDGDGKTDMWSDGFGVSNNPKLKLAKPDPKEAAFPAPKGVGSMRIILNYVSGLSVKPIGDSE